MAKAFLLRWGTQNDFDSVKLQIRELGFTVDNERLHIGGEDENLHIPNENYVRSMILTEVPKYVPTVGTNLELLTRHLNGAIAYSSDDKRLKYKTSSGTGIDVANTSDLPTKTSFSVVVELANIDTNDNNSVTLTGYNRPIELIFLNGALCTTNTNDTHRYTVDSAAQTLKIDSCSENDIISYF